MCLGLASGYIEPKEEKKTSLLKPYTNFDNIKDMNLDELAEKLATVELNAVCVHIFMDEAEYIRAKSKRKKQWLEWLASETENE